MGCPEWEEADFEGDPKDQFFPDWNSVDLKGYRRPFWFVQGPAQVCIKYLKAKRSNLFVMSMLYWHCLSLYRMLLARGFWVKTRFLFKMFLALVSILLIPKKVVIRIASNLRDYKRKVCTFNGDESTKCDIWSFDKQIQWLVSKFLSIYPCRTDKMTSADLNGYRSIIPAWRELFSFYDIIQAYATDPIIPLLAGKKPYIGYEHGTLRDFTLSDSNVCRNTSLAYKMADHVFITNGDCLEYAKKIRVEKFSPMIHPVDDKRINKIQGDYLNLHQRFDVKYLFLCTLRHDWKVKGTHIYIRALSRIAAEVTTDFKVIMTNWGQQVGDSKKLALELGVSEFIVWMQPLNRTKLYITLKSVDVLFDQIALPHFGATAPEGIAAGVPVIMSYNPDSTAWLIPEPAPILSAWTVEDIVNSLKIALDPDWVKEYKVRARDWIEKYHSTDCLVNQHLNVYRNLIWEKGV
jgi:hypothetical protein